jgi:hypothetical protein
MRYHAPPLPVDLKLRGSAAGALRSLQPPTNRGPGGLDKEKIAEALRATSTRNLKGRHEAFGAGDD